jgi:acetyl/propionyl-CoA carboxylase alpha subunit
VLQEVRLDGVRHNLDLLLATIESPDFSSGQLDTRFLEDHHLVADLSNVPPEAMAAVSALDFLQPVAGDPWWWQRAWRLARIDQPATWTRAGRAHTAMVSADLRGDGAIVDVAGERHAVHGLTRNRVAVDGHTATVSWIADDHRVVEWSGRSYRFERANLPSVEESAGARGAAGASGSLVAPMPARVVKVAVEEGQQVSQNQPLVVLEAMKMEHVVEAPHAGIVTAVCVRVGEQVSSGARLLTMGVES